ncbi:MAG: sensor histidine kinase [Dehalococcoidia bacterium]|nr:sensor histidine kinase [Dehalococcoidia bacterium]
MPPTDVVHLIRFAAILWIGYLIVLAAINQALWAPAHARSNSFYFVYCAFIGIVALLCLGLSYWGWIQGRLGKAFIPAIIAVITIVPIIATWAFIKLFTPIPMLDPQGSVLTLLPFLLVAFLLVAWQYKWQHMLLIILGIAGLNLGIIWSFPAPSFPAPGPAPFQGALNATLTQTVVFLAVGFSISYLVNRLKEHQKSLEAANIRLTHYASTLEQLATSRERNRLARELHDTLAHTLSGLAVQLETLKAYWDIDQQMARSILDKSLETARSGLEETRRALKALRASLLDDLGLAPALNAMAEDAATRANLALNLSITDEIPALSPDVEQCVYRVAQEAVINVVNHAHAKNLTVKLEFIEGKVKLIVRDDGIGFDTEKSNKTSHLGLVGIRERAQLIGGELNIISKPGAGTTIQLTI